MKLPTSAYSALSRARFVYAPPCFEGLDPSLFWEVKPPYTDAPAWQCSVYYFWYEYLRRHEGYRETCLNNGNSTYSQAFATFGDVHRLTFADWWAERFWLFEEKRPVRRLKQMPALDPRGHALDSETLYLELDLTAPPSQLFKELRAEVWYQRMAASERRQRHVAVQAKKQGRTAPDSSVEVKKSTAHYPVETKPVLHSLYEHLLVWDAKQANPDLDDADVGDVAGIRVNQVVDGETLTTRQMLKLPTDTIERKVRRRKQLAVQRHLRIARQYIDNVVLGQFPKRDRR